ncbi:phosphopantetheine-binding protein [Micromonospora haikouensis]|uniref:phosphopantetheine-binding protein n=1 Tax=Micromonospora haikouensis TaxID=686309 RepID=UPI0037B461C2
MEESQIWTKLRETVRTVVPEVPPEALRPDVSLTDLGCTSLDRADIVSMMLDDLNLDVPLSEFRPGAPLAELVGTLRRHTP